MGLEWSGRYLGMMWVSGRKRRCCLPQDSAALQLCLSARCTTVGVLRSINGLKHDEETACADVPFSPTWRFGGGVGEAGGGRKDDGVGENASLL